jgi:PAS domain S-box-containing protein
MQNTLKSFLDNLSPEALIERLKLALDGSRLGIWDWDLTDNSVQFDQRWCEMLGLDHATTPMTLETWSSRVHPDDLDRCYVDIKAHLAGRTTTYENVHRMRHADGRWISILDRGRISGRNPDGTPVRFTGTHFDVTAIEEARRVLATHDEQLQTLVANLTTGVAMLDLERRYLAASSRWLQLHHLTEAPVTGRPFAEKTPALKARWLEPIERALQGEASHDEETCVQVPGRDARWSRWDVRPWRRVDGTIGGVLISDEDITTAVLQRERAERERNTRLAALALFAGGVAHEINTPLQVILNEAALARSALAEPTLDRIALAESVSAIDVTARRAAAISRALRTLSRDAREDPPSAVTLAPLFDDAMALCRSRFASAGVTLTVENRAGDVLLLGRSSELLHVVLNLLNNAFDAVVNTNHAWIRLEAELKGGTALVRCIDGGRGVAPEHRHKLMTPFFTTKRHGTGIGLSVSRSLAERDGGFLNYRPEAMTSTFELGVPLYQAGPP